MTPFEILLLAAVGLLAVTVAVLWRHRGAAPGAVPETALLVQQQIDALRSEVQQSLRGTADTVNQTLRATHESMQQTLRLTTDQVGQQLSSVTTHLQGVTSQMQSNTGQVGSRLDNAAKVIQDVQRQLGDLGRATQDIKELGQSVSKLEELLKAPKLRGGLGELLLEDLLRQVLPVNAFKTQYKFRNGEKVDAIIQTSGGMVPVDSKFPLENFRKMSMATSDQERTTATRLFRTDVKKHIDDIAKKYIVPDEGTFDFALMYIPAENIYYETIIKDEKFEGEDGIYGYAMSRHVVPVSPNSFYAHLRVIALGFRGLQVEASAQEIIASLKRLDGELKKFRDAFDTLGTHLTNAKNSYDKSERQLGVFSDKLDGVQLLQEGGTKDLPPSA
ncbi:MAG: DNA recombination protein RmuC [Bacteroidetes bacterium]|jgi:DNA recombination protein RmuC|nr:DNA recombination protein RmuC [Bacteroidota bacterium]